LVSGRITRGSKPLSLKYGLLSDMCIDVIIACKGSKTKLYIKLNIK